MTRPLCRKRINGASTHCGYSLSPERPPFSGATPFVRPASAAALPAGRNRTGSGRMVDNFSIAISHVLIALAAWRLVFRPDLDTEAPPEADREPGGVLARQLSRKRRGRGGGDA